MHIQSLIQENSKLNTKLLPEVIEKKPGGKFGDKDKQNKITKIMLRGTVCIDMNSRFYQYHKMKNTRIENLLNNRLCFNNPKRFYGDSEDCKIHPYYEGTMEEWIDHYKQRYKIDEQKLRKIIENCIKKGLFQCNDGLIFCDRGDTYDKNLPLVTCFCGRPDNAYMWREYAGNHEGFCLCFKANLRDPPEAELYTLTIDSEPKTLLPVTYDVMPKNHLNLLDPDDIKKIGPCLITKKLKYQPENEYRILIYGKPNLKHYNKEELEGIIFGSDADMQEEKKIYDRIRGIYDKITFYKAVHIKDGDIVKIKPIDEGYFKSLQ